MGSVTPRWRGIIRTVNETQKVKNRECPFLRKFGYCPCPQREMTKFGINKRYNGKKNRESPVVSCTGCYNLLWSGIPGTKICLANLTKLKSVDQPSDHMHC